MSRHLDRERLAAFALGAMDEDERLRFEPELDAHLAQGCPECERALAECNEAVIALAQSAPAARPSAALRSRVLDAVTTEAGPARRPAWLPWAAILIVGLLGAWGWLRFFDASNRLADSRREITVMEAQLQRLELEFNEKQQLQTLLVAAAVEVITLSPTGDEPAPLTRVAFNPSTSQAVAMLTDATAPEGHDYQLWALKSAGVSNLGVIHADESGDAVIALQIADAAAGIQGFAVSLEPAGGSPDPAAPSGPVVAVGTRS